MKITFYTLLMTLMAVTGAKAQVVTTLVEGGSETKFRDDLIMDISRNVYCSDYFGEHVYKRSPDGTVTIFASGFDTPNGLAFDSDSNLFICDNVGDRIYKLDLEGTFLDTFHVDRPSGIIKKLDSDTLIFTQYGTDHTLSKLAPDGFFTTMHMGMGLDGPVGLAYDASEQLYVANFNNRQIFKVFEDTLIHWATVPGPPTGSLGFISFGGQYLWGTSWNSNQIFGISTTTADSTFLFAGGEIGGIDGDISEATFSSPNGILSNPAGDTLYISEFNPGRLRMISPNFASVEEEIVTNEITLYPNPAQSETPIHLSSQKFVRGIWVTNLSGQVVHNYTVTADKSEIIIPNPGQYLVHMSYDDDQVVVERVTIVE